MSTTSQKIKVAIRVSHTGATFNVELPLTTTGDDIVKFLVDQDKIPARNHEGEPQIYEIILKGERDRKLPLHKSLFDQQIKDGATLLLAPIMVAG